MGRQDAGDDAFAPYGKFTSRRTFTHHGLRFKNSAPLTFVGSGFRQFSGPCVSYKKVEQWPLPSTAKQLV
jgi:hypothetical protein